MSVFEALFRDDTGCVVLYNLHAASKGMDRVVPPDLVRDFARRYSPAAMARQRRARGIAESIVFDNDGPRTFQLRGPEVRLPERPLVNIQALSSVQMMLAKRYDPLRPLSRRDPQQIHAEVQGFVQAHPDQEFGYPDRLLWIAEQDDAISPDVRWLLESRHGWSDEAAQRLERAMRYFGLPIMSETHYLVTEFSFEGWGERLNEDTYRRPTVFDGVDGDYFKQDRILSHCAIDDWNKTIDLASLLDGTTLRDGAWEAVGKPLTMARITRSAVARSGSNAAPLGVGRYVAGLQTHCGTRGILWRDLPQLLAEFCL